MGFYGKVAVWQGILLREKLFNEAISKNGKLEKSEVYTFVPVLAFGGAEDIEYLQKGKAQVYQVLEHAGKCNNA